jgi:AmmeMemoRadiSam system protein B
LSRSVRPPAVSGLFYEADPGRLRREVERLLDEASTLSPKPAEDWRALLLPHAGYVYSGRIAAKGVAAVSWPARAILLGPNHRGVGVAAALSPASAWRTPLGDVPVDRPLADALLALCPDLKENASAHAQEHALEVLLPHAGYVYSGRIAAKGVAAVSWPARAILLGPNHRGVGVAAALSPASAWRTPLGDVPVDRPLAEALLAACPDLKENASAHAQEHALEVLLPFLQAVRPDLSVVCVSLGEPDLDLCLSVGSAAAQVVQEAEDRGDERIALVVSSDLSHYLPRKENRKKDDRALDALLMGDPRELFTRVLFREHISMCGILPSTALLAALGSLPGNTPALLAHGDSADAGGDEDRVVGYASVLWSSEEAA